MKKQENLNIKKVLIILAVVFLIIILFTFIDYLVHSLSQEYSVPQYYFKNKILFGTLIGFISYIAFRKQKAFVRALYLSLTVSILLQIRYFLEGYSLEFVLEFLLIHFIILLVASTLIFWIIDRKNIL